MASVETMFILNFILNMIIAVTGIIIAMLIPSTRKIRDGEAGTSLGAGWIPIVLGLMVILSAALLPLTLIFLEGRDMIFAIVLDGIAIGVTVLALREFFSARKAYKETFGDHEVVEVAAVGHHPVHHHEQTQHATHHEHHSHAVQQEQHHQYIAQQGVMTVECPNCGNHIQIAAGSDTITCPYCGIFGSL